MKQMNPWLLFFITQLVLWPLLAAAYAYQTNRTLLKKKGYNDEYIPFIRRDVKKRILGIAVAVPLIELVSGLVCYLVFGSFDAERHLAWASVIFLILVVPFPLLDALKVNKDYKKLARQTGEDIYLDLNHTTLHRIFKPRLEMASTALCVLFIVLAIRQFHIAFFPLAFVWFLYFQAKGVRNMTKPALRDAYVWGFFFMVINHLLVLFYLGKEMIRCCPEFGALENAAGWALVVLLTGKIFLYLLNFLKFKRELSLNAELTGE